MIRSLLVLVLSLAAGCSTGPQQGSPTAIEAGIGFNDFYSSSTATASRDMCRSPVATVHFEVSQAQLQEIGQLADREGFFALPPHIYQRAETEPSVTEPGAAQELSRVTVTSPCEEYSLDIYHAGQHHRVDWDCDVLEDGKPPRQVRQLFLAVEDALKPAFSKLPQSECRYY